MMAIKEFFSKKTKGDSHWIAIIVAIIIVIVIGIALKAGLSGYVTTWLGTLTTKTTELWT